MITLTENTKRILFVSFFVLFSIATGYALYYFFFRPLAPTPEVQAPAEYTGALGTVGPRGAVTSTQPGGEGQLPIAAGQGGAAGGVAAQTDVNLLRDSVTQAVSTAPNGDTRYYNPEDGRFYRINDDGTLTLLSDRQFFNIQDVAWGKSANEAILDFPDGSKIYYNFEEQRQVTLPQHWSDFDFAPKDDQIVAKSMGIDENNRFLITAQPDSNDTIAVYHMGANADLVIPSWSPDSQVIAFSKTGAPQPDNAEQIYLLGKNHETRSLIVPGRGFMPSWSPTGKKLLFSAYHDRDQNKPTLWICDANGQDIGRNRQRLNLNTWADKCVWSDENVLFCAVPIDLPVGAGYDEKRFVEIPDDIYYINLSDGTSKKISTPDQNHPVQQPILSKDKSKLIFTDAVTGKLYSYNLNY